MHPPKGGHHLCRPLSGFTLLLTCDNPKCLFNTLTTKLHTLLAGVCSLSAKSTNLVTSSSNTPRSLLLEGCQTAWYNGSTADNPAIDENGGVADIMCVTPAGNVSYNDAQCHEGYNGLLCADCDDGWGNSRTFHCNQCMPSAAVNTFLIFLGYLASFCYVAWLVRGSLASAAQVGTAGAGHFEQFSDMMKVTLTVNMYKSMYCVMTGTS